MSPSLIGLSISFLILAAAFYALERAWPAIRSKPLRREGFRTDLAYWFFTPLVTKALSRFAGIGVVAALAWLLGWKLDSSIADGFGPVILQPTWLIVLEMFLLADFLGYWMHRLFHGRRLWRFHAVHHSSTQVDWLSSVRLHPFNDIATRSLQIVPLLLLGFPLKGLAVLLPFISLHALLLHANVPWTFGRLRYVISSPVFHRWHHTTESQALDKNFAGFFPLWDILFNTSYMPRGRQPSEFGVLESDVPEGFFRQLLYPFRPRRKR